MLRIDQNLLDHTTQKAVQLPRLRKNHNFHHEDSAIVQRLINAMEPGTYIQPHKHEKPDKTEYFLVLRGRIAVFEFDETGKIIDHVMLGGDTGNYGVEIAPGTYHSLISLENGSVAFEIKEGPYDPDNAKSFAQWAPPEGSKDVEAYLKTLYQFIIH